LTGQTCQPSDEFDSKPILKHDAEKVFRESGLTGDAEPTDADIAFFDAAANRTKILVQEITGTLTNLQRHRSFV
jgi:hypothetical protein